MNTNGAPWADCWLKYGTHLLQVTTNIIYHHSMTFLSWLSPKEKMEWNVCKSNARWRQIFEHGWHSKLSLCKGICYRLLLM